ncbi:TonB-dependent receptor [Cellulophaga baltica]|uniref:TonB-dependent receptor n=1 Tax=Cellulophaga TaxID=104264 RepID=UPI001C0770ED|nr:MULTISPECIES: TonB-dependent receptor [Cellulophaga]MBU2995852.1 TonB-dependent receptor [Cellulophaga baltica]MDO6767247.1 TonB-dependent receptor [Cellulophaga sp. 1_MG-2023]
MKKTLSLGILTLMRVFLLFITIGLSTAYANYAIGQNKIDVALNETSMEQFFNEIQTNSDYIFFYKDDVIKTGKKITLNLKDVNISTILDQAFLNTSLIYKIEGKQIVVKKVHTAKATEVEDETSAQEKTITGTVYDVDGVPLVGVNILVEGTTNGTQTDFDGNYAIKAEEGSVLVFSYIGMLAKSVSVVGKNVINVTLEENAATLDEVVIVGYGSQKKEALTGAVSVVKGVELEQAPTSTFEQSLRGSVAGLQGAASDGAPGANTQIRIRGIGSINASSEPLYVIDGIPVAAGSQGTNDNDGASSNVMASINPNDIESISVLKDAASTAIYGSRGANGVILVTTKQGKSGKAVIELKTLTGFVSQASKDILKPLNAAQYKELYIEGYVNDGLTAEEAQTQMDNLYTQQTDPTTGEATDTNWLDAITRTGVTQSYDLSVRGATDRVKYFMSGGYMDQESYIIGYGFSRFSGRTNLEYKATDYLTISNNISVSDIKSSTAPDAGSWNNPFKSTLELSPLIPIYDADGEYNAEHVAYFPIGSNPVGSLSGDDLWDTKTNRIIDNFAVSVTPIKNLIFRSQWNFDLLSINESIYYNRRYGSGYETNGYAYEANTTNKTWVGTQTLDYSLTLNDNHNFNFLAGYEAQQTIRESFSASGSDFPNDVVKTLSTAAAEYAISGSKSEYTFSSAFLRANYNFDNKYFLSGSIRNDGSSRFGSDNKYGTFYSFGASWNIFKENFLDDVSFINLLKLRTSYGVTGNAAIGNFASLGLYGYGDDYDGSPGGTPSQLENTDLTWETQENFNIGLDFGIFDKINGTVEYFDRLSSDLILDVPISPTTGFTELTQNYGSMSNKGLELTLNVELISKNDFNWNVGFNTTFIKNEITELDEDYTDGAYRRQVGQDFQSYYMYGWAGVDQTNGDVQYYTDASETTITNDIGDAERYLVGKSATPDFYGGFNTAFSYKDFSLSANFMYSSGNYLFDSRARGSLGDGRLTPRSTATYLYENRWVEGKTDALFPRFQWGGQSGSNQANVTRWLYDGSYIRLKDLTVAYRFPEKLTSILHLSSARLYARGTNVLTWTKEKELYIDPEQSINGSYNGLTPAMKTISLGLDIQL